MVTFAKAMEYEPRIVDDVPSLVFKGTTIDGVNIELAMPIKGFQALAARSQHHLTTLGISDRARNQEQISTSPLAPVQTVFVSTTPTPAGDRIALVMDRGTPQELGFQLLPNTARQVAQALLEQAEVGSVDPPMKN